MNGFGFVNSPTARSISNSVIEIYYQNVRGLRTKLDYFRNNLLASTSDLFAITESGCSESIQDAEIVPPGYNILRCDRADGRKQGGALLVATHRFELRQLPILDASIDTCVFEMICATVHLNKRFLFVCCVVYIPPGSSENDYMLLFRIIEKLCVRYGEVIVIGDFNLYSCPANISNYFECFLSYCEFTQSNTVPNHLGRQLDLVLSAGISGGVTVVAADEALVPVDAHHPPLAVSVRPAAAPTTSPAVARDSSAHHIRPQWNWNRADFQLLYSRILSIDWSMMYGMHDLEEMLNFFYDNINCTINGCVPRKKLSSGNSRYVYPVWYTRDIIKNIQIKATLHKKFKKTKLDNDYHKFAECRTRIKKLIETAHKQHKNKIQYQFVKDPKSFWQYIRSKRKTLNKQSIIKEGQHLTDDECAVQFADFFESVYSKEPPKLDACAAVSEVGATSARVHIETLSLAEVRQALGSLKPKRSSGPDGIPAFLFRDCGRVLAEPLLYIFNACLQQATFPQRWKITRVVPVPKGKPSSDTCNYRPVAVLSTPAKVLESAIQRSVQEQMRARLSDAQHGFRPGRSTATNLINFMVQVVPAVDSGVQVDAAYFDFKKAFDTVDNDILLRKLAKIGCTLPLIQFFASYMKDRQQYVDYNGCVSQPYYTRSGVSQGSNVGPLEFIVMINDLPEVVRHGTCLLFADDLKLLLEVRDHSDCERLQEDIDRVVEWSNDNKLHFNVAKCSVMSFTRARTPLSYQYKVEDVPMQRVSQVRDLGVVFSQELTFREHINKICKKAYRNLGFVLRQSQGFTNITTLRVLYDALVRSHLEHSAFIWAPHEAKYSVMLERIQNKFTRHLYYKLYGVYPLYPLMYPTLFVLGMVGYNTLRVRREFSLAAYVVKLLRGVAHNPGVLRHLQLYVPDRYVWRRHRPPLLAVPAARTNLLARTPLTRAIRVVNEVHGRVDVLWCNLSEFAKVTLYVLCYLD